MDHDYIQEHQVVDLYVMGRLSEAEADLFEDHYLTCDECLRRLELARKFQSGLRRVAAEDATGLMGILAAFVRSRRGLVAGSVLAVLLAASTMIAVRSVRLEHDLEETRARLALAGAEQERRAAAARSEAESLRARMAEERERLDAILAQEREARGRLEKEVGRSQRPLASGVWLVTLVPVRSGPAAGGPVQRITLPPKAGWIVLALDLDLSGSDVYRAILERQGGEVVWKGESLHPSPAGGLAISLDASLLAPGDYRLRLEQVPALGPAFPVSRFTFRVGTQ